MASERWRVFLDANILIAGLASCTGASAAIRDLGESEQIVGFYTMIEDHLGMPLDVEILGVIAAVERIDMTDDEQIVAVCRRGRARQAIPILDLELPVPPPTGAEWIEAYRRWARGT